MKTAVEKAEEWMEDKDWLYHKNESYLLFRGDWRDVVDSLTTLLKEQDRDTRHACLEAIREVDLRCPGPRLALADAILNTHFTEEEQDG